MCLKWRLEYIDCLLFLTWFYIWRAACSPIAARLRWNLWLQWDCIYCLCGPHTVGVGDVTSLACGCSSWLNRVVYYPWVAWLFQYLAAGFSKTRDFITKLSGTADYYYLRAPPSVPFRPFRSQKLHGHSLRCPSFANFAVNSDRLWLPLQCTFVFGICQIFFSSWSSER